ncbi:MAG: hypothetical protein AYK23_04135 [Candidatus Proteinoplasmatales archaeon SG8-5]|nr:MAG: hypothetical protein AYK23_04135 [Candidatus Proteinoplasmatales archaeon SG8-5]
MVVQIFTIYVPPIMELRGMMDKVMSINKGSYQLTAHGIMLLQWRFQVLISMSHGSIKFGQGQIIMYTIQVLQIMEKVGILSSLLPGQHLVWVSQI